MRIAVVAGYAPSLVNFRGPLIRAMAELGHEVTALAPKDEPEIEGRVAGLGAGYQPIALTRRGMNPIRDWITLRHLRSRFARIKPDKILCYTIKPVIWGSLAARLERSGQCYSLVTGLGQALTGTDLRARLFAGLVQGLYRAALRQNELVFFQNPDDEAYFRNHALLPERVPSVVTAGSGVDLDHFAAAPVPADGPPTFVMVARLLGQKGVAEFARAAQLVKREHPEARFHLVGPLEQGPGAVDERDLADWREQGLIQWFGFTGDVRPRLAEATAFVLPSYYGEGLPRTSLEAAATGRAIITTDHPGCREAVVPGETGLLVPVRDADALAGAMKILVRDPALAERMGRAGRALAEERFDAALVNRVILRGMGLLEADA